MKSFFLHCLFIRLAFRMKAEIVPWRKMNIHDIPIYRTHFFCSLHSLCSDHVKNRTKKCLSFQREINEITSRNAQKYEIASLIIIKLNWKMSKTKPFLWTVARSPLMVLLFWEFSLLLAQMYKRNIQTHTQPTTSKRIHTNEMKRNKFGRTDAIHNNSRSHT